MKRFRLSLVCLVLLASPLVVGAASVSPSVLELQGGRGDAIESSFTIYNTSTTDQTYFLDRLAFEAGSEDGVPAFTPDKTGEVAFLSWIDFLVTEVVIPGSSKVDVPFTVVIPDDIASGSYHGAITVSTAPSDIVASNGALLEAKTAILVFLTVEGETTQQLELMDFEVEQTSPGLPLGTYRYRVQNQGNVHLTPAGTVTLVGLFGQTIASVDANQADGRVLPGTTRTYEATIDAQDLNWLDRAGFQLRHLALGPVRVQLTLAYGENGSIQTVSTIWVFPVELLTVMAMALALIFFLYKLPKRS